METTPCSKRVAIVGCGYVGMAVGRRLVADGAELVVTTTTPARCRSLCEMGFIPVVARLDQVEVLRTLLVGCDAVLLTVSAGRGAKRYRRVYAEGAKNLVLALGGSGVRRIIYTSSTRVYRENAGGWVDENSSTRQVDSAGQALVEAENTLLNGGAKMGASTSVLRLGGIHGPGRDLVERIWAAAGSTRNDGEAFVNLVNVLDVVETIARLIPLQHHGVLNVTDGKPLVRRSLYDYHLKAHGRSPIHWQSSPDRTPGKRVVNRLVCELLGMSFTPAPAPPP